VRRKTLNLFGTIVFLSACGSTSLDPAIRLPAMNDSTDSGRLLLESALSEMMNGISIIIADDAFVNSSDLIIERRQQTSPETQNENLGRDYGMPDHFKLWKRRNSCLLEHLETGEMKEVIGLNCVQFVTQ